MSICFAVLRLKCTAIYSRGSSMNEWRVCTMSICSAIVLVCGCRGGLIVLCENIL